MDLSGFYIAALYAEIFCPDLCRRMREEREFMRSQFPTLEGYYGY